jgi:hypothetical protein
MKIVLFDNSRNQDFFNRLKEDKEIKIIKDPSNEKENLKRLINCRNKILEYGLKNKFDYILMMDCDVIVPTNIISELMKPNKDIISGLYINYFIYDEKTVKLPAAWRLLNDKEFDMLKNKE